MTLFAHRVSLVTGAASGIGAASARMLAAEGALVYCADLDEAGALATAQGISASGTAVGIGLDVCDEPGWETTVATILQDSGRLDLLVHCAGISAASPLIDTTEAEWRRVLDTNLGGTFLALKHGIRAMRERGGVVIAIGSASGIRPTPGAAGYATSKAAVTMLARTAAKECRQAGYPVRVNLVSPAGVRTPMWRTMPFFQQLVREHGSEEAAFQAMEAGGGGPMADPEEVAAAVVFLASDQANGITGVELAVDNGYTL